MVLAGDCRVRAEGGTSPQGPWKCHVIDDSSRGADGVRLADVNGDGLIDITTGWEEGGITRVYLNPGHAKAKDKWPAVTVGKTPSVEDAVFADLDGDGAMDVISCCEGRGKTVFVHWGPKDGKAYLTAAAWRQETLPPSKGRMQWMFAAPMQVDGVNGVDIIAGAKGGGAEIGWFEAPRSPRRLADWKWHTIGRAGWIMSLIAHDMDGDGDLDVVASDRRGGLRGCRWLENPGPGPAQATSTTSAGSGQAGSGQAKAWKNHFIGGQGAEVMFMKIADLDGDGLKDAVVATRSGKQPQRILWFRRLDKTGDSWKAHSIEVPPGTGTGKAVAVGDIDKDGRQDIVLSCEGADRGKSGVIWLSYTHKVSQAKWKSRAISGERGIKFDRLELVDIDGDGDPDVLTCEERQGRGGMGVFWYENPHAK